MRMPLPAQWSAISMQKRLAVAVLPVPTGPVMKAVSDSPSLTTGANSMARESIWLSLPTSFSGT